jgi:beta-glucosidase
LADVKALIDALTRKEKAALTVGEDMMSTVAIERLGIPKVRVTVGPSGARGDHFAGSGGPPATCIPCGSAIGATWNPILAEQLGALVGREALDRGCRRHLPPTVTPAGERRERGWRIDPGRDDILLGRSSVDLTVTCSVEIPADSSWRLYL